MNRVPWRRDDVLGPDGNDEIDRDLHGTHSDAGAGQPDLDLRLRDAADTEPERPLLVWPQDDTPRMGRAAGAAYLAFLVLLAFGAVWVIERDVEGPTPVAEQRASEESPPAETRPPVEPDVPPALPKVDDLALNGADPAAPPDLPVAAERPAPPAVPPTPQPPPPQEPPRPTVTAAPRLRTEAVPSPPEPPPLALPRPSIPEPVPVPPARAATTEPPQTVPRSPATEDVSLPRVAVGEPNLAPPPAPANVPASPPAEPPAAAPPAAAPAAAASAPSTPSRPDVDSGAIRDVLGRYRSAFNALDAKAAQQVWPSVDERTLDRAFGQLEEQNVSFDRCTIDVKGVLAEASCSGTTRFVPRVGNRSPQVEPRRWSFSLRKAYSGGWQIQEVRARRSE